MRWTLNVYEPDPLRVELADKCTYQRDQLPLAKFSFGNFGGRFSPVELLQHT